MFTTSWWKRRARCAGASGHPLVEAVESRTLFSDLVLGPWSWSLPATGGNGTAEVTAEITNDSVGGTSGSIRLQLQLSNRPYGEDREYYTVADGYPLATLEGGYYGTRTASEPFDLNSIPDGIYYVVCVVSEYTGNNTYTVRDADTDDETYVVSGGTPPPDNDNSFATARDLGSLPATGLSNTISASDPEDYFRFSLPAESAFSVVLGGLSDDLDLTLYNGAGDQIGSSRAVGTAEDSITQILAAGTYYFRVYAGVADATSTYSLGVSSSLVETPDPGPNPPPSVFFKGKVVTRKPYKFTVRYTDTDRVNLATVGGDDVLVTGPNGFSQPAQFVKLRSKRLGTVVTATYIVQPPRGLWYTSDNGTYQVQLQNGTVSDMAGSTVPATTLGAFTVRSKRLDPTPAATGAPPTNAMFVSARPAPEKATRDLMSSPA